MYMRRRYKSCCCQNHYNPEAIETACDNVGTLAEYLDNDKNSCECGFDDDEFNPFPENPTLAQSYVPIQIMDKTFVPSVGLKMGTIFPELVSPYSPGQSMAENDYLRDTNDIKEGCNKCTM